MRHGDPLFEKFMAETDDLVSGGPNPASQAHSGPPAVDGPLLHLEVRPSPHHVPKISNTPLGAGTGCLGSRGTFKSIFATTHAPRFAPNPLNPLSDPSPGRHISNYLLVPFIICFLGRSIGKARRH